MITSINKKFVKLAQKSQSINQINRLEKLFSKYVLFKKCGNSPYTSIAFRIERARIEKRGF